MKTENINVSLKIGNPIKPMKYSTKGKHRLSKLLKQAIKKPIKDSEFKKILFYDEVLDE